MAQQFTNNARALLVAGISYSDTSLVIQSSKADLFPVANTGTGAVPAATNWFKATLQNSAGAVEIIYVRTRTAGSGVFSNILRGQEGTAALSFVAGTVVGLRVTAQDVQTALDLAGQNNAFTGNNTFSGTNTFSGATTLTGNNSFTGTNTFTGPVALPSSATAVTQTAGNSSTALATTEFASSAIVAERTAAATLTNKTIASPALTGTPTTPTASTGTNNTQVASTAFVTAQIASDAPTKFGGGASGTWNINISGTAAAATLATNVSNGFGVGQVWQGVGRGSGAWYQNTTGRPIMVFARWGTFNTAVSFNVNPYSPDYSGSTDITFTDGDGGDSGDYGIIVVPHGHYYTCNNWGDARELR